MIKSAPVGPVAGGIMGCIMVLVLAVYAYRHQIHRRSHQHMSPLAAQGELKMNPTGEAAARLEGQWLVVSAFKELSAQCYIFSFCGVILEVPKACFLLQCLNPTSSILIPRKILGSSPYQH